MATGLIGTLDSQDDPTKVAAPDVKPMTAITSDVNKDTDTTAGQLGGLLAADSPYLQRARAGAAATANSRGLLNSSMAAGAGEAAAIDAALPIANADAQTFSQARLANQQVANTASQFNADASNKSSILAASAANDLNLQNVKGQQSLDLANIEASYKTLMQASDSAGKLYQQSVDAINKILVDPNLGQAAKDSAVSRMTEQLKGGLNIIGKMNNLDLVPLLSYASGATGTANA